MLEATMVTMGWVVSNCLIAGVSAAPHGQREHDGRPSGTFRTGDGLLNIAANKQEQFEALCRVVGRAGAGRGPALRRARGPQGQPRRADRRDSSARWPDSAAALGRRAERGRRAGRRGADRAAGARPSADRRARSRHTFADVPGVDRDVGVVRAGFRLESGDPVPQAPPPALGADTDDVLAEIGLTTDDIARLRETGAI